MWPRVVEVMLGCWLAMSPWIFEHAPDEKVLWVNDMGAAAAAIMVALLAIWPRARYASLLNVLVGAWLVGFGRLWFDFPPPPAAQNEIVVGLLLLMMGIIPTEALLPPRSWWLLETMRR